MTAHSRIGASSMSRWSKCPGSVRLSQGIESRSSSYAEDGLAAHALAEECLRFGYNTRRFVPVKASPDMAQAVQVYLDAVRQHVGTGDVLTIEQRFDLSAVHPGCFGTADAVVWQPSTQRLVVFDYKHGAGIPVDVENNPQLQYYGLGALIASKYPARKVSLVIVQPRCEHPDGPVRSWEIDAIDLLDFRSDLKQYAETTELASACYSSCDQEIWRQAYLAAGDHCRFCPALRDCPAVAARQQALAKAEFAPGLPYDPEQAALLYESLPVIEARIKAVREFFYAEAEAGRVLPRHKLVAKRATRKWRDEGAVIDALQNIGARREEIYEPSSLKSPAQLEKVCDKAFLAPFIVSESSGHVLAPESDKRPAVTIVGAKSEFGTD